MLGVGDERSRIGEGESHGLDLGVEPFGAERLLRGRVEAAQDAEREQRRESLAVRRALPDAQAPVLE